MLTPSLVGTPTAIHLVHSGKIIVTLNAAGVPRWALSGVTLACNGQLVDQLAGPSQPSRIRSQASRISPERTAHGGRMLARPAEALAAGAGLPGYWRQVRRDIGAPRVDIDAQVESCLGTLAEHEPAALAMAVDAPISAALTSRFCGRHR
jgi:hypothetical protein